MGTTQEQDGDEVTDCEIIKTNDDRQLVFGWAQVYKDKEGKLLVDHDGDYIRHEDDLERAAYDFVLKSRDGGVEHVQKGVATLVESVVFTKEKMAALGIKEGTVPEGWWVGYKVHDDSVWKGVKSGRYKMFSVHGKGRRRQAPPTVAAKVAKSDDSGFTVDGRGNVRGDSITISGKRKGRKNPGGDHGPSIKYPHIYEALRRKGMSKEKAARISNSMHDRQMKLNVNKALPKGVSRGFSSSSPASTHLSRSSVRHAKKINAGGGRKKPRKKKIGSLPHKASSALRVIQLRQRNSLRKTSPTPSDVHVSTVPEDDEVTRRQKKIALGKAHVLLRKYNMNHGSDGRFTSGSGGGRAASGGKGGNIKRGGGTAGTSTVSYRMPGGKVRRVAIPGGTKVEGRKISTKDGVRLGEVTRSGQVRWKPSVMRAVGEGKTGQALIDAARKGTGGFDIDPSGGLKNA